MTFTPNRYCLLLSLCTLPILVCVGLAEAAESGDPSTAASDTDEGFVSMFNGRDLSGWEGRPGAWRVEDGAITGSTNGKPSPATHYLYWKNGQPADFVMRCKIKLLGGNSGIQFRSEERPNFDTFGYQADFDVEHRYTGALYQHARGNVVDRGVRAVYPPSGKPKTERFAAAKSLLEHVNDNDWNEYEVTAIGPKITLKINGRLMSEVIDHSQKHGRRDGIIALQMHRGPPMTVQFKDLRIKVLAADPE